MIEVHVNFPNSAEASAMARTAVERRLAAAANVHGPMHSYYWWDGAVQSGDEVPVVFKTPDANVDALMAFVAETHSYEIPSIVAHQPVRVHPAYREWVHRETEVTSP